MPFQQPTVLKVEKGTRPLKLEEAVTIAEALEVSLEALTQYVEDELAAEAVTHVEEANIQFAHLNRRRMVAGRMMAIVRYVESCGSRAEAPTTGCERLAAVKTSRAAGGGKTSPFASTTSPRLPGSQVTMASVEKRIRNGQVRWYARYRDPNGAPAHQDVRPQG